VTIVETRRPGFSITRLAHWIVLSWGWRRALVAFSAGAVSVLWSNSAGGSGTAVGTASWTVAVPLAVGSNAITVRAYSAAGASSWRSVTVVRK